MPIGLRGARLIRTGPSLWMILATIVPIAFGGAYLWGRLDGARLAALDASETARRVEREANRKINELQWQLQTSGERLQALRGELLLESADDPDADRLALSPASLRRIGAAFGGGGER